MKEIIELADKACSDHSANPMGAFADYLKLKEALSKRKELEATPITEDWLKEHGWIQDLFNGSIWGGISTVNDNYPLHLEMYDGYARIQYTPVKISNIADLYDACELCGIKID